MARGVDTTTWVLVLPPHATDVGAFLQDDVGDPGLLEPDTGADSRHSGAHDHGTETLGDRCGHRRDHRLQVCVESRDQDLAVVVGNGLTHRDGHPSHQLLVGRVRNGDRLAGTPGHDGVVRTRADLVLDFDRQPAGVVVVDTL
jgi:hypothetical protein